MPSPRQVFTGSGFLNSIIRLWPIFTHALVDYSHLFLTRFALVRLALCTTRWAFMLIFHQMLQTSSPSSFSFTISASNPMCFSNCCNRLSSHGPEHASTPSTYQVSPHSVQQPSPHSYEYGLLDSFMFFIAIQTYQQTPYCPPNSATPSASP